MIELLVVIAIVALLMSIIMPSLAKAREQGKRAVCKAFLRSFVLICSEYAQDYNHKLPSFSAPNGPHVHDLSEDMVMFLERDYSLEHHELYCPSIPKWRVEQSLAREREPGNAIVVGYNYWVPRYVEHYSGNIPPAVSTTAFTVLDESGYAGPSYTYDKNGSKNPVITDSVSCFMKNPPDCNIGRDRFYDVPDLCTHKWNNLIDVCNQAYIDGHVEAVSGVDLEVRYGYGSSPGGSWIWR